MEYTIETKSLSKKYDTNWAVRNVSIHIPKGQIYGLLGRNGAGKTTLMKTLLGLADKNSGAIILFNQEIKRFQREVYMRIGSTIETPGFYPNLTAFENLAVLARLRGRISEETIRTALQIVGLPFKDKKPFCKYSLGMRQRLAIANAIMNNPDLLILDEPTNGLDPIGIAEMRSLIKRLSRQYKKTILISSHQLSEMEQLVDWIGIIHEGVLLEECSYSELKEKEQQYILLKAEQPDSVCQFLRETLHIDRLRLSSAFEIEIFDMKYSTLFLNKELLSAGFNVMEIFICHHNLEDHFKSLTGGVGIA